MLRGPIAVIVSGFPRRSETFVLADLLALDAAGLLAAIFATKDGEPGGAQPGADRLASRVQVLAGDVDAQALAVVDRLRGAPIAGVHAYFAHRPAEVAAAAAGRLGVPFGFSVHARDARKIPRSALWARAARAACVIACNPDVAAELDGSGAAVHLVPHGVDLERFRPRPAAASAELRMLAVGRLVEKKGFDVLLAAAARLEPPWRLRIVGEGPERTALVAHAEELGVADRVTFCGSATHDDLPDEYSGADIVVVPSVVDRSGDRDGVPNVLLEAMSSGRAVVASDVGAIASAITPGATALLVPPGDSGALARALGALAADASYRAALGSAARLAAERNYDVAQCTRRLASVVRNAYA